jgi:hypothetical protein
LEDIQEMKARLASCSFLIFFLAQMVTPAERSAFHQSADDTPTTSGHFCEFSFREEGSSDSLFIPFWIGVGFGYGLANALCEACGESGMQEGSTAAVKLGYGFSQDLLVGLEADLWINGDGVWDRRDGFDARKIYRNRFMAVAFWQPSRESGFTVKLGAGLSFYSAYNRYLQQNQNSTSLVTGTGVAATIGAGYDLKMSRTLILTPSISYNIGASGDLLLNEHTVVAKEKTLHLLDLSISIVFRAAD